MKTIGRTDKLVSEQLPYELDFTAELPTGVTIASQIITITGPDAVLTKLSDTFSGAVSRIWLNSGTQGATYMVGCKITSTGSPTYIIERAIEVTVR
jgi:hypothetical protein